MNRDEIRHIANIAMLDFSEETLDAFSETFNETMELIDRIKDVDTKGMSPIFHVNDHPMPLRVDETKEGLTQEEATQNTASEKYGYFEVMKFVD